MFIAREVQGIKAGLRKTGANIGTTRRRFASGCFSHGYSRGGIPFRALRRQTALALRTESGGQRDRGPTLRRLISAAARTLIFLSLGCMFCFASHAGDSNAAWGKRVLRIELHSDAQLKLAAFAGSITQQVGEPLSSGKVSQSLKNLFATGRFRTLRADVQDEPGGVALIFAGEARFFAGKIEVQEKPVAVDPATLASSARLNLGQPLTRAGLAAAGQRIRTLLAANGYHEARVNYSLRRNTSDAVANVIFNVVPGRPAALSGV
ncbi:MAG: POTRA domain-containing protein, partial [Terriglobia bacterium]